MKQLFEWAWNFVWEKVPFALAGLLATSVNFCVFLLLADRYLPPGPATMIAYTSGAIINFFVHRYFVFNLNRSAGSAFLLSMAVSVGGLFLDWLIVTSLLRIGWLGNTKWLVKLVATGTVFLYNFYAKRRVFEGARTQDARAADEPSQPAPDETPQPPSDLTPV